MLDFDFFLWFLIMHDYMMSIVSYNKEKISHSSSHYNCFVQQTKR